MKSLRLFLILNLLSNITVENQAIIIGSDPSDRHSPTYVESTSGNIITLEEGEALTVTEPCTLVRRGEVGWDRVPIKPKAKINLKNLESAIPAQFSVAGLLTNKKRRVILNYPPCSSVWHLPMGIGYLAAILHEQGHEVMQRYGHILGLEYVLKQYGSLRTEYALIKIRSPQSGIIDLFHARKALEHVSSTIVTNDKFAVQRNNVIYVSEYYDGTIERALEAVRNREGHLWYEYFTEVEVQKVLDFQPDLYGISIADERQFIQGIILASLIKDALPKCLVVLGGNFWSRVTSAFQLPEFARFFDHCDAIVYREGFQPIVDLANTLDPRSASGTVWRDGNKVVVNPPTTKPTPFETLPTPQFDGGARQWSPDIVYPLYTISNCPHDCGFCGIAAGSDTFLKKATDDESAKDCGTHDKIGRPSFRYSR